MDEGKLTMPTVPKKDKIYQIFCKNTKDVGECRKLTYIIIILEQLFALF